MTILITRPEPDASRMARHLKQYNINSLVEPLMTIEHLGLKEDIKDQIEQNAFSSIIITSTKALDVFKDHPALPLEHYPLFCVGPYTAELAKELSFKRLYVAKDGEALSQIISDDLEQKSDESPMLYLCGTYRDPTLETRLKQAAMPVLSCSVYTAHRVKRFSDKTRSALETQDITGVIVTSKRLAQSLCECAYTSGFLNNLKTLPLYCISRKVAAVFDDRNFEHVQIAPSPDMEGLLSALNAVDKKA